MVRFVSPALMLVVYLPSTPYVRQKGQTEEGTRETEPTPTPQPSALDTLDSQ